jgi:hypothetical protein
MEILSKDSILEYILPHLQRVRLLDSCGKYSDHDFMIEIVSAILYLTLPKSVLL